MHLTLFILLVLQLLRRNLYSHRQFLRSWRNIKFSYLILQVLLHHTCYLNREWGMSWAQYWGQYKTRFCSLEGLHVWEPCEMVSLWHKLTKKIMSYQNFHKDPKLMGIPNTCAISPCCMSENVLRPVSINSARWRKCRILWIVTEILILRHIKISKFSRQNVLGHFKAEMASLSRLWLDIAIDELPAVSYFP